MKSLFLFLAASVTTVLAALPELKFRSATLDDKIQIGYGVAVADVDGDGKPDVLLADKKQFVWYRNPGGDVGGTPWPKYLLAENLTKNDNACIAAQDIDGDGKCEVAVGAEWNPGDTLTSGAVFYLIAPEDRTKPWEPVKFPSVEPTTHRMKWITLYSGKENYGLVVAPLHGRGNKNGEGAPVKVLMYLKPTDPRTEWKSEVVDESMHMTHNIDEPKKTRGDGIPEILIGGREGVRHAKRDGVWKSVPLEVIESSKGSNFKGAGEVRDAVIYISTIEPMHGNSLVAYTWSKNGAVRRVLTDQLTEGHALACADFANGWPEQIVVGWRGNPQKPKPVGIKLFTPDNERGEKWKESWIDENGIACEDLTTADLNGDGKPDIVASGRATKNLKIYLNETRQ